MERLINSNIPLSQEIGLSDNHSRVIHEADFPETFIFEIAFFPPHDKLY